MEKNVLKVLRKAIAKRYLECYKKADIKQWSLGDKGINAVMDKVIEDEILTGMIKVIEKQDYSKDIIIKLGNDISSKRLVWKEEALFIYTHPIWGRIKFFFKYL